MGGQKIKVFVGNIVHCPSKLKLELIEDGFLVIKGKEILAIGDKASLQDQLADLETRYEVEKVFLTRTQLLIPGLIDTHIHAPQYPNCGLGYDKTLLEWLDQYTFHLEKKYRDVNFAKEIFRHVVRDTLNHGTTTACYFGSLFTDATIVLADEVEQAGQRALVGKINMTCSPLKDYVETEEESIAETMKFIENILSRKNDLVQPIITPRFALSVDMKHMTDLGILAKNNNLHIQTHISENKDEVQLVNEHYHLPYAQVYEHSKLLTEKTILAHGVHLTHEELQLIADRGASIAHCPESNTCLKSGLCDVKKLLQYGIKVGLGTDVSGGSTPSIRQTMKSALDTSIHVSFTQNHYDPLTYSDVFYLATLGGAEALSLDGQVGNFIPRKDFDALLIDMGVQNCSTSLLTKCSPLELLQKFIYSGDDRNILNVFVAGRQVK